MAKINGQSKTMTFWCQFSGRIHQGDKSKREGVKKPWEGKKQTEKSLSTYKIATKMVPGDILTTWHSGSIFTFPNFSSSLQASGLSCSIFHQYESIEGKGICLQMAYTVYREHRQNPYHLELSDYSIIYWWGSAGKNKATKSRTDEAALLSKSQAKMLQSCVLRGSIFNS